MCLVPGQPMLLAVSLFRNVKAMRQFLHEFGDLSADLRGIWPLHKLFRIGRVNRPEHPPSPREHEIQVLAISQHRSRGLQNHQLLSPKNLAKPTGIHVEARPEHCLHETEALASRTHSTAKGKPRVTSHSAIVVRRQCIHQRIIMKTGLSRRGRAVVRVPGGIVRFSIANRQ